MEIKIIKEPIGRKKLADIAENQFGDMVKVVVDIAQEILAIGGEFHSEEEVALMEKENSRREDTWGINVYPEKNKEEWIEFDSMINIKPSYDNLSRGIESQEIREKIRKIIEKLII